MARTNSPAVEELLLDNYGGEGECSSPNLRSFIATANVIVNRINICATAKGITLTPTELEMLERWLAAHYYQQSDRGYTARSTADASASFQGQLGMGFESTMFGQTALQLDPSGCLAAIGKRKPTAVWLGKNDRDSLSYDER